MAALYLRNDANSMRLLRRCERDSIERLAGEFGGLRVGMAGAHIAQNGDRFRRADMFEQDDGSHRAGPLLLHIAKAGIDPLDAMLGPPGTAAVKKVEALAAASQAANDHVLSIQRTDRS